MRWYEITHLDALERLERVLAACVSGWQGPEETARALASCIVELDQARRVAPSRDSQ
jgi:hypothetical protein